ncbi:MAG: BrnT family toxin [Chloroflexota bacterium]
MTDPQNVESQPKFEWDDEKNKININKHELDFADAWEIFLGPVLIGLDDREDYGEDRWIGIGMLKTRTVVVLYTERGENVIRIISLRKATTDEQKRYEEYLKDELGEG